MQINSKIILINVLFHIKEIVITGLYLVTVPRPALLVDSKPEVGRISSNRHIQTPQKLVKSTCYVAGCTGCTVH